MMGVGVGRGRSRGWTRGPGGTRSGIGSTCTSVACGGNGQMVCLNFKFGEIGNGLVFV